jgi:hypothetical protein
MALRKLHSILMRSFSPRVLGKAYFPTKVFASRNLTVCGAAVDCAQVV